MGKPVAMSERNVDGFPDEENIWDVPQGARCAETNDMAPRWRKKGLQLLLKIEHIPTAWQC